MENFNLKAYPKKFVILPGANKFPIIKGWQLKRKTPKKGWENCKQAILLCGKVSGVTVIDVDDEVDWYHNFTKHHNIP